VDGVPSLRQAIADKLRRDNGLDYRPDQILVSNGAKHSLFNLCLATLDAGDEVIIPAPYWVSYPDMVLVADGSPVTLTTDMAGGYRLRPEQLEAAITPRTKLVVLNSPSNPSGKAYRRADWEALGAVLRRHPQALIVTDDIYESILWMEEPFSNIVMACPDLADRTIVVNGVSKAYAMTGWRIGYAAGPVDIIKAMKKIQSQSTSNPSSISQAAAEAAITGDQDCVAAMVAAFRERHDYVYNRLNALPGVSCLPSDGTFYAFPDFNEVIRSSAAGDDVAFAEALLNEAQVALVPGSAFGMPGHMRLSYATGMDNLRRALDRIEDFLKGG
jgi:aspartate aminotransferase